MNKGDYMVHWSGKVCMVEDMAEMNLTGTKRMYFILTPVRDKAEKIYVPIEKTEGTLRPVLSRKEAVSLAGRIRDIEPLQIKDEKQRAQEYKTAYYSQDYLNLVRIAKELYHPEVFLGDLVQEGNVGLILGVDISPPACFLRVHLLPIPFQTTLLVLLHQPL